MKIGHFMRGIWDRGGIASYIRRVSEEQVRLGHHVFFFDTVVRTAEATSSDLFPTTVVEVESELYSAARSANLDILHVHTVLPQGAHISVPTIRTVHGHQPYCPSGSRFFKRAGLPCGLSYNAVRCTLNHFVQHCGSVRPANMAAEFQRTRQEISTLKGLPVLTVSGFIKEQMRRSGYDESLINVLYLPAPKVKQSVPPPALDTPHFVFLGRISPTKGVNWLLHAVSQLSCKIHLDIAGVGDDEVAAKALSQQLGLSDRVTFHGWVGENDVFRLLTNARALIFPSLWHEPGGTIAFEAMVNARAVIMSRVGGMPEIVLDDVNGLVVEPADVGALTAAIADLAGDWEKARRLGQAGCEMIDRSFTLEDHVRSLSSHYDRCILSFSAGLAERRARPVPVLHD